MHLLLDVALVEIQDVAQPNRNSHYNSLPQSSRAIVPASKGRCSTVLITNRPINTNQPLNGYPSTSDPNLSMEVTYARQL